MSLLVLFAFIGGVVTILSPCILPILPIVLSGSVASGKKRPIGIVLGFIVSFTFFTLFLTSIVRATGVSADVLRNTSIVILVLFGITLLLPQAQAKIEQLFSTFASRAPRLQGKDGLGGGFIVGLSIGLLWTPCVGPILASVISLALTGSVTGGALIITLAYSLGTALPMLAIMYGGRQLLQRVPWLLNHAAHIQKAFGVLMIIVAVGIAFNIDRSFQTYILEKFPNYGTGLTSLEDNDMIKKELEQLGNEGRPLGKSDNPLLPAEPEVGVSAPELIVGGEWVQGNPITIADLKGQVVLIDFMAYSCINCIRTLPYLNDWYARYKDQGFTIIGVHTPEFEFEKDPDNVRKALKDFGIEFPVMQDNNFATWRAYDNHYWPRKYILDHNGNIVYDHIGEGAYDTTELKIQELLAKRAQALNAELTEVSLSAIQPEIPQAQSPETYFGAWRNELLGNGQRFTEGEQSFERPDTIRPNTLYLVGDWNITREYAEALSADAKVIFAYTAKNVFMVAGAETPVAMTIRQDGEDVGDAAGQDAELINGNTTVTFSEETLYRLIENEAPEIHVMELTVEDPGLQVFTFTFG